MKYFTFDHHGEGFEYHGTAKEAKAYAKELIDYYVQNDEEHNCDVCWGEIKEQAYDTAGCKLQKVGR